MTQIVKTDAVVLKSMKYRETSLIVSIYTRQFGKISGIVKGARQPKSKYGSALQPMSYVSIVLYKKESRELQTVTQCDVIKPFRQLSADIGKMAVGMSVIELIHNIAHEEEENQPLFGLLIESLCALNDATKSVSNVLYHFELRIAALFGFQPRFDNCVSCDSMAAEQVKPAGSVTFHLDRGGIVCGECTPPTGSVKILTMKTLRILKELSMCDDATDALNINVEDNARDEISGLLWEYLRHHITGMRELKSQQVFSQIFDGL